MDNEPNYCPSDWAETKQEVSGQYLKMPESGWVDVVVVGEKGDYEAEYEGKKQIKRRLEVELKGGLKKVWDIYVPPRPRSPNSVCGQLDLIRLGLNNVKGIKTLIGQRLRLSNVGKHKYKINLLNVAGDLDEEITKWLES